MNSVTDLKERILAFLEESRRFADTRLQAEYPAGERDCPLQEPVLAVGVHSASLEPGSLGGYLGEGEGASLYGAGARIEIRFDLLIPRALAAEALQERFERLCDLLLLEGSPFGFTRLEAGPAEPDKTLAGRRMRVLGILRAALTRSDTAVQAEDFIVKRL